MNNETISTLRKWKKELEEKKEKEVTTKTLNIDEQIKVNQTMVRKNTQEVYNYIWKKVLEIYKPYRHYDKETLEYAISIGKTNINPNRIIGDYVDKRPNIVIKIPGTRYHNCNIPGLEDLDIWRILQEDGTYIYFDACDLARKLCQENIIEGYNHDFIFYIDYIKQLIEKSDKLIPNTNEENAIVPQKKI